MRKFFTSIVFLLVSLFSYAQNIPVGIRMEVAEFEMDENEFSIFSYKDEDGTFGYYLSLGRVYHILEYVRDDIKNAAFNHVEEVCVCLGSTAEEALESVDSILELFEKEPGTVKEFDCRLSTGAERLGKSDITTCTVKKKKIGGKRLNFVFKSKKHTAEVDLSKSAVKSLRLSFKINNKLHPDK